MAVTKVYLSIVGSRVLARIPNLAVQICLWVVSYFCGRGRTKTCVLGCCRNFFLWSYTLIPSVIFRHTVFSIGYGMNIYTIDKLYEQHMTINRGIQQILQVVISYLKENSACGRP